AEVWRQQGDCIDDRRYILAPVESADIEERLRPGEPRIGLDARIESIENAVRQPRPYRSRVARPGKFPELPQRELRDAKGHRELRMLGKAPVVVAPVRARRQVALSKTAWDRVVENPGDRYVEVARRGWHGAVLAPLERAGRQNHVGRKQRHMMRERDFAKPAL